MTNPSYAAAYTYASDGLRLRVQESNNPNPDRWMQYDGVRPVLEGTLDGQGNFTTLNKYLWEGSSYYSPLMYSLIGGAWRYHLYDGLGSTRQLMLHASPYTVTDSYSYEAFGNLMASIGTTPNPYRYVGSLGYYATGSSLMHLGARYYMPEVGRLVQPDPLRPPCSYVYCSNGPANRYDPSGLSWIGDSIDKMANWISRNFKTDLVQCACFVAGIADLIPTVHPAQVAVEVADCLCQIGTELSEARRLSWWQLGVAVITTGGDCVSLLADVTAGPLVGMFVDVAAYGGQYGVYSPGQVPPGLCACERLAGL